MNIVQVREDKMTNLSGHIHREIDYMDKYLNKMVKSSEKAEKPSNPNAEESVNDVDIEVDTQ